MPRSRHSLAICFATLALASPGLAGCYDLDKLRTHCGDAIVCDDFESGALDPQVWTMNVAHGAVTVDAARAHSGTHSLYFHIDPRAPSVEGRASIETAAPFPLSALHARAYLWGNLGDTPDYDVLQIASAAQPLGGYAVWREDHGGQINLNEIDRQSVITGARNSAAGEWHCIEWELTNLDGATGSTGVSRVWVDGGLSLEDLTAPNGQSPRFDLFRIGTRSSVGYAEITIDFWIDDVVLSNQRIGCTL